MRLSVRDLCIAFALPDREIVAVERVSFDLAVGERMALLGESGCGKTVLLFALLGLLPSNARVSGRAAFDGRDLLTRASVADLRGRDVAICWSNAERFFNPVRRVGAQIDEAVRRRDGASRDAARARTAGLLAEMGFDDPGRVARAYPFQLSGGMNQRAMLAMSLAARPRLLLVDEPTRGLDDRSREHVIDCLTRVTGTTVLVVTHDVGVAEAVATRVAIMREGRFLETGTRDEVLRAGRDPYTRALVAAWVGNAGPLAAGAGPR